MPTAQQAHYEIHPHKRAFERNIQRYQSDDLISEANRKLVLRFSDQCFAENLSVARINKYLNAARTILHKYSFDLSNPDVEALKGLVSRIQLDAYAYATKVDFKIFLKKFYRWLKGEEFVFKELRWLKAKHDFRHEKLPTDLLSEEEVLKIVGAMDNPRDKALYLLTYESGCRIGEVGGMRVKDLDLGSRPGIHVSGKTGERVLPIKAAVPPLRDWLRFHPRASDRDAPLFCNIEGAGKGQSMIYQSFHKIFRVGLKKAGVNKEANPHNLRHSRLTFLAGYLTEAELCAWAGWAQGSDMARVYVHLGKTHLQNAFERIYGKGEAMKREESLLKPVTCTICGHENQAGAEACYRCAQPLTIEAALKLRDTREKDQNAMLAVNEIERLVDERVERLLAERHSRSTGKSNQYIKNTDYTSNV